MDTLEWAVNCQLMGWSTAFRRRGPAEAGTPTAQITIVKALAIGRDVGFPLRSCVLLEPGLGEPLGFGIEGLGDQVQVLQDIVSRAQDPGGGPRRWRPARPQWPPSSPD